MDWSKASTPPSRHTPNSISSVNGVNNNPESAAMLTDPRALKQHLANGTFHFSHFRAFSLPPRRSSEPPRYSSSSCSPVIIDLNSKQITKDDAYHVFNGKGKNTAKTAVTQPSASAFSSQFDPRRLLDPKAFGKDSRKLDERGPSIIATPSENLSPLRASPKLPNGEYPEVNGNGAHKRDHDNTRVPGMGSLIERIHNVSQREERPQKKQKIETFEDDDKYKKNFAGGGKGGEIGEYIKQKKKEGIEEDGSSATIVDLTGGMCTSSYSSACYLRPC